VGQALTKIGGSKQPDQSAVPSKADTALGQVKPTRELTGGGPSRLAGQASAPSISRKGNATLVRGENNTV